MTFEKSFYHWRAGGISSISLPTPQRTESASKCNEYLSTRIFQIGDITKETSKPIQTSANRSLFKAKSTEPVTPTVNGASSASKRDITSIEKRNKENESSKGSKLSNGPTSLLLYVHFLPPHSKNEMSISSRL